MKYILRFDDITPEMSWSKFLPLKGLIEDYNIKSILGVVPRSLDPKLSVEPRKSNFFCLIRGWADYGDAIAQHGTNHVYCTKKSGILGINNRSEFSGLAYSAQFEKINKGKLILENENVWQPWFMAPAHSFDKNTIKALLDLDFRAITDGYGFSPYKCNSILFVPQMSSSPIRIGPGVSTICLHINSMSADNILEIKNFIIKNHDKFIDFKEVVDLGENYNNFSKISRAASQKFLKGYRAIKRSIL
jgi:predicted deacetylase